MARQLRVEYPGAIYHITVRGNARQNIFLDDRDRERFLIRLADSVDAYEVRLYLYCLMSNHYHLLVETPKANISRFMQSLETGYTGYFNLRHGRCGHLTQGRFGGKLVEGDKYLLTLARYVHLNPVRISTLKDAPLQERRAVLRTYRWSSFRSYVGLSKEQEFVDYGPLRSLTHVRNKAARSSAFKIFVEQGLAMTDQEQRELLCESPRAIGSEGFLQSIDELYREQVEKNRRPEDISFRHSRGNLTTIEIMDVVCEELKVTPEAIQARTRGRFEKALAARMLWRYSGLTKREIARELGLGSAAAVTWQMNKLEGDEKGQGVDVKPLHKTEIRLAQKLEEKRSARSTHLA